MGIFDTITNIVSKKIAEEVTKEVKTTVEESIKENVTTKEEVKEDYSNNPVYKKLRQYRWNKSVEESVKPYYIFNNETLEALIKLKPESIEELKKIKGFGPVKSDKYGEDIINIIREN